MRVFFWKQMLLEPKHHGFCPIFQVLTLATENLVGDWLGLFRQSQTGSCTAPHKQQLQTAQFPVPPRPPAQEGPIKTSHITPSLCLCVPSLLRVGGKKKPGLNQIECATQTLSCGLKEKNLFTCVNSALGGTAAVVCLPLPHPALHVFLTHSPSLTPP